MKPRYSIIYCFLAILLLGNTGCKKFVEDGNVNTNPNKPATTTLNTLLPAVIDATSTNHYQVAYTTSMLGQQMASYQSGPINDDQNRDVRMGLAYYGLYQRGLTNSKLLYEMAGTSGSPFYTAIGKILFVVNLSMTTDVFGDVPFTEAFQSPAILYPNYDAQQGIYTQMLTMLDDAIAATGQANPATLKPGTDDLIFGGDMNAWKQTAYLLKARLYLHLSKKTAGNPNPGNALTALANGYTNDNKDCQLVYNDKNLNPWAINVANRIKTGNFTITPAKRFVDILNGNAYPGLVDPRVGIMLDKKTSANYIGMPSGSGGTGNTTDLTDQTYYGKGNAPVFFTTFFEQKFIEAEARFLANGGTASSVGSTQAAYDAYIAGITAHMAKMGVTPANITTYLANPLVGVGPAGLTMELIMKEKNIAMFLHPDAWVDVRRYDYSATVFKGMAIPANQDPLLGGAFIRRSLLPLDELSRNPNAQKAIKPITEKMWWDQ